jgi:hypothetical protein
MSFPADVRPAGAREECGPVEAPPDSIQGDSRQDTVGEGLEHGGVRDACAEKESSKSQWRRVSRQSQGVSFIFFSTRTG